MTDLSSITSSATSFVANQTAKLGKAVDDTKNSFAAALNRAEVNVGIKPKTGFTAGPTYQANEAATLSGQTKAAMNSTINTVKSALHIK
jgi:hypothetical protein